MDAMKHESAYDSPQPEPRRPCAKKLSIDIARYDDALKSADFAPEDKEEFLRAMWSLVVGFVDLGYEVHPVQAPMDKADRAIKLYQTNHDSTCEAA